MMPSGKGRGVGAVCRYKSGTALGLLFGLGLTPLAAMAQALPSGGSVTSGTATIVKSGPNLLVTQTSPNAIVSWRSFSIGGHASAHFDNGTGATLNRVTGSLPSSIDGALTATGSLYLINPAGVAVGTGGMVRTGGSFVASTHDAGDADFLDGGDLTLKGASKAEVINRGFVTSLSGDVVLTARRVENTGTVEAANGSVGLLGGYEVELRDTALADGKFAVRIGGADTEVVNSGTLKAAEIELRANGGSVQALAGNTTAIVKATGVKKTGGRIFLTAGDDGVVEATQTMVARRAGRSAQRRQVAALPDHGPLPTARPDFSGGEVHVSAGAVSLGGEIDVAGHRAPGGTITATAGGALALAASAALDASGRDGGLILLGGDYQGGADAARRYLDRPLATTATTHIAAGATVHADGMAGDGGRVVVWSDGTTTVKGLITARGGPQGNGGAIETSGQVIDFAGVRVDASSPNGLAGSWLIDPEDITVDTANAATIAEALNAGTSTALKTTATIALGPGVVTAGGAGDITIAAPITWSTNATLTLDAYHSIAIDAAMTLAGAGGLTLITNNGGAGGTLSFAGGVQYTGAPGGGQSLTINGRPYTLLYSMAQMQGINGGLAGNYALARPQDASAIPAAGVGRWIPLGTNGAGTVLNGGNGFAGAFTGLGNTISDLTIDIGPNPNAGLFGFSKGTIGDIGLIGGAVTGGYYVGGLVGYMGGGSVSQSYATGSVTGGYSLGGLVGYMGGGSVSQSYATGSVTGGPSSNSLGGLVGYMGGDGVSQSYATGPVVGGDFSTSLGGLVGYMLSGGVSQSYATGSVTSGTSSNSVGGLVGYQIGGDILLSHATGGVTGGASTSYDVGGLVGHLGGGGVSQSYATGPVVGGDFSSAVGGLVGNMAGGDVSQSYATGSVTGGPSSTSVGGLVGLQSVGDILLSYATGGVTGGSSSMAAGGLVGYMRGGDVSQSYATGSVMGGVYVGGLVGFMARDHVNQSYAAGSATGVSYVGGLVGYMGGGDISQSYATGTVSGTGVGGLIGLQAPNVAVVDSYFDKDTTGRNDAGGLSTAQLQAMLAGGFDPAVWGILPNGGSYPYLKWRFPLGPSVISGTAIDISGGNDRLGIGLGVDGDVVAYGYTGVNGYYNFMIDPVPADSSAITWLTGERFGGIGTTSRANAVREMPAIGVPGLGQGVASGLDLYAETVNVRTGLDRFTNIAAMMDRALYGAGAGVPLYNEVPNIHVFLYDTSLCGCGVGFADVSFVPGPPQASMRMEVSAPLLTWDYGFDQLFQPLNLTLLAAGDVVVADGGGIVAGDINGGLPGTVALSVNGDLTLEPNTLIGGDALNLNVGGDLSVGMGALLVSLSGINAAVVGNVELGGAPHVQAAAETIRFDVGGNFIIRPDTTLLAWGTGNAIQLAVGGLFDNQAGADALLLDDPDAARWLVYLASPTAGHAFGGLDSQNTAIWNTGAYSPIAAAGSRYVFAYQPTLTFISNDATKIYGESGAALTYSISGLMKGVAGAYRTDTSAMVYSGAPQLNSAGLLAAAGVAGGPYAITIADMNLASTAGYAFDFSSAGKLTVTPRSITVSAGDQSRIYGNANPALTWTVGGLGLVNGDTLTGSLATAGMAANVGAYAITRGTLTANDNYALAFAPGSLTVSQRSITVSADDQSRIYGHANPALTWTVGGMGLVNGDTLTGSLATAGMAANVGAYAITRGTLTAGGNYALAFAPGSLTVSQRSITVSADDQSRIYGHANPALTWTVGGMGLVNGDTLTGSLATTATGMSDVGVHAITRGTLTAGGNYALAFASGSLTVSQRSITVRADDLAKLAGFSDPSLTWTLTGGSLASFDDAGSVFSGALARQPGEAIGNYAIGPGSLAATANYALSFVAGAFVILPLQYADGGVVERQGENGPLLLFAAGDGDAAGTCSDGVLGPECAAYVNPGNRDLGPHISTTE